MHFNPVYKQIYDLEFCKNSYTKETLSAIEFVLQIMSPLYFWYSSPGCGRCRALLWNTVCCLARIPQNWTIQALWTLTHERRPQLSLFTRQEWSPMHRSGLPWTGVVSHAQEWSPMNSTSLYRHGFVGCSWLRWHILTTVRFTEGGNWFVWQCAQHVVQIRCRRCRWGLLTHRDDTHCCSPPPPPSKQSARSSVCTILGRTVHTTAFSKPAVENWLEQEIAQWVLLMDLVHSQFKIEFDF